MWRKKQLVISKYEKSQHLWYEIIYIIYIYVNVLLQRLRPEIKRKKKETWVANFLLHIFSYSARPISFCTIIKWKSDAHRPLSSSNLIINFNITSCITAAIKMFNTKIFKSFIKGKVMWRKRKCDIFWLVLESN